MNEGSRRTPDGDPRPYESNEVELDGPKEHEVLVRYVASGICHSDVPS